MIIIFIAHFYLLMIWDNKLELKICALFKILMNRNIGKV